MSKTEQRLKQRAKLLILHTLSPRSNAKNVEMQLLSTANLKIIYTCFLDCAMQQ